MFVFRAMGFDSKAKRMREKNTIAVEKASRSNGIN